jgi:membrane associated rhomboid family serine protease
MEAPCARRTMFFAFPLNAKPDWRNPPWITVLLILINCLVFFGPQRSDERREDTARQSYRTSGLGQIELPRYADYLERRKHPHDMEKAAWVRQSLAAGSPESAAALMERDARFMRALRGNTIVRPDEPIYEQWHPRRVAQDAVRGESFTQRWASNPSDWSPLTLLTSIFLHGSVMHLVGNMVFLFVFGYTVEMTLGRWRYVAFYLLAGIAGDLGDLAMRWGDSSIGLGASGAISGLMALYAMLYGMRKIRFFYQFLFYFDYVTAPAIILLPLWIIDQLWLQFSDHGNGVAYMAHVGGLLGGALLGAYYKWQHREAPIVLPEPPPPDPFPSALARAESLVKAMKMDEAREAFAQLVSMRPHSPELLTRYYNLARLTPAGEHFHRAAAQIFALRGSDPQTTEAVAMALQHYLADAQPRPRLGPDLLARLALRLASANKSELAEKMAGALVKLAPQHPQAVTVMFSLARMHHRSGNAERSGQWMSTLQRHHPESAEARMGL